MTDDTYNTIIRLAELLASSSATMHGITDDLRGIADPGAGRAVPDAACAAALLNTLHRALIDIGRTIGAPSVEQACPATARPQLSEAADMISRAAMAIRNAGRAAADSSRPAGPLLDFPHAPAPHPPDRGGVVAWHPVGPASRSSQARRP